MPSSRRAGAVTGSRVLGCDPERGSGAGPASSPKASGTAAWPLQSYLELGALPSAVSCARLHAVHVLREWGLRDLTDDAALIVSELVTNAVDASIVLPDRPPVALRLLADERCLAIEVWDHSPADPAPRQAAPDDECWRGLAVVEALTTRWGTERSGYRRKVVWAELTRSAGLM